MTSDMRDVSERANYCAQGGYPLVLTLRSAFSPEEVGGVKCTGSYVEWERGRAKSFQIVAESGNEETLKEFQEIKELL